MFNNADPVYNDVLVVLERDRSLHAAERHELEAALRHVAARRREQKNRRAGWWGRHRSGRRSRPAAGRPA